MPDIMAMARQAGTVVLNDEVRRIENLPRRSWDTTADELADNLTEILRTDRGDMSLRPIQAVALYEVGTVGGLFGPLRCGAGKTLIAFLAPEVGFAERPLMLVPASLVSKTRRDEAILRRHWKLPTFVRVMSYEWLGRVQAAGMLDEYAPDMIIADEVHRLKNPRAAVTRRVRRFMNDNPNTKFIGMSGTVVKRSLKDFAHILRWCVKPKHAPIPKGAADLEVWADAIDERKGQVRRADPGALIVFCNDEEKRLWLQQGEPRRAARQGFRRRLVDTPGVVATKETPIDASLAVNALEPPTTTAVDAAFHTLRHEFKTPDGWPIADGLGMFRHARELALGFYYVWNPRPPKWWLIARTMWCAYVRKVLKHSRTLDSELQVRNHVDKTQPAEGIELLEEWLEVRDEFTPNTEPRWIDDSVVEYCANWLARNKGIAWVEHTCFGNRLSELSGLPFYRRKGLDASKNYIEDHKHGTPLIASIASNSTGRNLQHGWSINLITSMMANGLQTEQLVSRTHRDGQTADEVRFDVIVTCAEHIGAFWQAVADCEFAHDTMGSPQKLLVADIEVLRPDDIAFRSGARWDSNKYRKEEEDGTF